MLTLPVVEPVETTCRSNVLVFRYLCLRQAQAPVWFPKPMPSTRSGSGTPPVVEPVETTCRSYVFVFRYLCLRQGRAPVRSRWLSLSKPRVVVMFPFSDTYAFDKLRCRLGFRKLCLRQGRVPVRPRWLSLSKPRVVVMISFFKTSAFDKLRRRLGFRNLCLRQAQAPVGFSKARCLLQA
ncbi:hypothetical protein Cycma_3989 [Cyclobacterium marinum DSM 745]|uniref:Uncharacterized protein n=1 Tax=Cyclobacterium marinum (strain ATCC 25205 / DSM 745 / LMG 13164 / NCIMB 1802) TaxID=880070 RepID=G0J765_CYCMS|nr:hypothetical protein Cycma_3989 [Cyclobacterium marinum DSM 745]